MFMFQDQSIDYLFVCPYCTLKGTNITLFTKHLKIHESEPDFLISCPVCKQEFGTVGSWRKHLRSHEGKPTQASGTSSQSLEDDCESLSINITEHPHSPQTEGVHASTRSGKAGDAEQKVFDFSQKLEAKGATSEMCSFVAEHFANFAEDVKQEVREDPLSANSSATANAFRKFKSQHLRDKKASHQTMVRPRTVVLPKGESFQYVPLLEQLTAVLNGNVLDYITSMPASVQELYRGVLDGEKHRTTGNEISIILYADEFQLGNVLGNKKKKTKITGVYYSLAQLPGGQVKHVFLSILTVSQRIKEHSWSRILKPLLDDVQILQTKGLNILVDGSVRNFKGSIEILSADNLGQHQWGCFFASFTKGKRLCRFCYVSSEQMNSVKAESQLIIRTQEEYEKEVARVKESGFDKAVCSAVGLKDDNPFSSLEGFKILESQPPDLTHDVFEGIGTDVLGLVLTAFVRDKLLTVDEINACIQSFPYTSTVDTNKPEPNLKWLNGRVFLKQTASETYTLIRLLPLMIGKHVNNKKEWALYLDFVEIVLFLCAPTLSEDDLVYLQSAIECWLVEMKDVFAMFRVTCKYHYLLHYCSQIRMHGPPRYYWTICFERKHRFFKKASVGTCNSRNLCKTLAVKHQRQTVTYLGPNMIWKRGAVTMEDMQHDRDRSEVVACRVNGVKYSQHEVELSKWVIKMLALQSFCLLKMIVFW